ncbi:MAG: hypothetical protein AAF809_07000 [Bacteroidota bacterium]
MKLSVRIVTMTAAMAALALLAGCDSSTDDTLLSIEGGWAATDALLLVNEPDGTIRWTYTLTVDGATISGTYASVSRNADEVVFSSSENVPVTGRLDASLQPEADFRIEVDFGESVVEWEGRYVTERDEIELFFPDSPAPVPPAFITLERVDD